jgi:hypothetical protein
VRFFHAIWGLWIWQKANFWHGGRTPADFTVSLLRLNPSSVAGGGVRQKSHEPPNLTISPKSIYLDPPMMMKFREFRFVVFIKAKANFEFSLLNCEFYLPIFAIILVRARLSYLGMPT